MAEKKKKSSWWKWLLLVIAALLVLAIINGPKQVSVSEAQINAALAEDLNQDVDNPLVSSKVDLKEDVGELELKWEQGQTLTANIEVSGDGLRLVARDVNVEGAGIFTELFEGIGNLTLNNLLTNISLSQRNQVKIEIQDDQLIGHYQRR